MAGLLALAVAALVSAAVYLLLSSTLVRMLLGFLVLGHGVNLLILAAGRVGPRGAPILPEGAGGAAGPAMSNPLPQALILTAIVISFAFFAFLLVLAYRALEDLGTDDIRQMRVAEPEDEGLPPLGH